MPLCYLLYRTSVILNFLQEYINSEQIISGRDFTGELFNTWMFALPFIIILALGILFGVMIYKKKPKVFYIYNILVLIALLVIYNIGYNTIGTLEAQIIETRTLRLIRDIYTIIILFQGLGLILTFIRATGFDIKKFDFNRDLEQLDITEADAEEFEVDVNIETNLVKRDFRKAFRFAKYIYIENKFIINGVFLILFAIICFTIYMNLTIYNKTYKQGQTFSATEFNLSINNSYLTNKNYLGKQITDNYLLIVELDIQAHYEKATLNTAKVELRIDDDTYYPNNKYSSSLIDLGIVYNHSVINSDNFETQLLIYEIPKELIDKKMTIKYLDSVETNNKINPKYIKVKLEPYNLDKEETTKQASLNEQVILNEILFDETSIKITNFEIQDKFKLDYKYCTKVDCYDSVEYINPVLNTNYDKVLLKIDGEILVDEEQKNMNNLYTIIKYFGKIKYKIGRKTKYYSSLTRVTPKKATISNSYYIEIPKEVIEADELSFIIDARNEWLEYVIKK